MIVEAKGGGGRGGRDTGKEVSEYCQIPTTCSHSNGVWCVGVLPWHPDLASMWSLLATTGEQSKSHQPIREPHVLEYQNNNIHSGCELELYMCTGSVGALSELCSTLNQCGVC